MPNIDGGLPGGYSYYSALMDFVTLSEVGNMEQAYIYQLGSVWKDLAGIDRVYVMNLALARFYAIPQLGVVAYGIDGVHEGPMIVGMAKFQVLGLGDGQLASYPTFPDTVARRVLCGSALVYYIRWLLETDFKPLTPERAEGGRRQSLILGASGFADSVQTPERSLINDLPLQTQNMLLSSGLMLPGSRGGPIDRPVEV